MRCIICDFNEQGLSEYNQSLNKTHGKKSFYDDPDKTGGYLCDDCTESYIEVMHEFHMEDEIKEILG